MIGWTAQLMWQEVRVDDDGNPWRPLFAGGLERVPGGGGKGEAVAMARRMLSQLNGRHIEGLPWAAVRIECGDRHDMISMGEAMQQQRGAEQ